MSFLSHLLGLDSPKNRPLLNTLNSLGKVIAAEQGLPADTSTNGLITIFNALVEGVQIKGDPATIAEFKKAVEMQLDQYITQLHG